jgi:hypothetical protein
MTYRYFICKLLIDKAGKKRPQPTKLGTEKKWPLSRQPIQRVTQEG